MEPLALRRAIWSLFSGMVCLIFRPRRKIRVLGCEYALSARSRKSWSYPPSARALTKVDSMGLSPACPPVSAAITGVQLWSASAWIFVLNPPRERPSA